MSSDLRQRPPPSSSSPLPSSSSSSSSTQTKKSPTFLQKFFPVFFRLNTLISILSVFLLSLLPRSSPYFSLLHGFFTYFLSLFFLTAGSSHFTMYSFFMAMIPSFIPTFLASVMVIGSGLVEMGLGAAAAYGKWTGKEEMMNVALWGIFFLLIAVYPINIYTAFSEEIRAKIKMSSTLSLIRLPIQFLFLGWTFVCTTMSLEDTKKVVEKWGR